METMKCRKIRMKRNENVKKLGMWRKYNVERQNESNIEMQNVEKVACGNSRLQNVEIMECCKVRIQEKEQNIEKVECRKSGKQEKQNKKMKNAEKV